MKKEWESKRKQKQKQQQPKLVKERKIFLPLFHYLTPRSKKETLSHSKENIKVQKYDRIVRISET